MPYTLENLDQNIFRAYDIRGIVGSALTDACVYHLGRAFATQALSEGITTLCVAADGRISSPHLKQLLIEGKKIHNIKSNKNIWGRLRSIDIWYLSNGIITFSVQTWDIIASTTSRNT